MSSRFADGVATRVWAGRSPGLRAGAAVPRPERLQIIDALRGISILWVTLFHFWADVRPVPGAEAGARAVLEGLGRGEAAAVLEKVATAFVGSPSFRIDLFLFLTGLILMTGPSRQAGPFLARRARAVLPNYWLGTLLVAAVLIALAALRGWMTGASLTREIAEGSRLAGATYYFEPGDILRSLFLVGRFENSRTMQVVAPSLWYVTLVLQAYVLFVPLRWLLGRIGRGPFVLIALAVTWCARALVFRFDPLPGFGPYAAVIDLVPFHLAPLAAGMVAAAWTPRLKGLPTRGTALALIVPAALLLLSAVWGSRDANRPGTLAGILGPIVPLSLGLPAIWVIATTACASPGLGRLLAWAGRHSLSVLVVQDALRLTVGTLLALGIGLGRYVWPLIPVYLAASLLLARAWDPFQRWIAESLWPADRRAWDGAPGLRETDG